MVDLLMNWMLYLGQFIEKLFIKLEMIYDLEIMEEVFDYF